MSFLFFLDGSLFPILALFFSTGRVIINHEHKFYRKR